MNSFSFRQILDQNIKRKGFSNQVFARLSFKHCKFSGISIQNCTFIDCTFIDCTFYNCIIRDTVVERTFCKDLRYNKCKIFDTKVEDCALRNIIMLYCITKNYIVVSKSIQAEESLE